MGAKWLDTALVPTGPGAPRWGGPGPAASPALGQQARCGWRVAMPCRGRLRGKQRDGVVPRIRPL